MNEDFKLTFSPKEWGAASIIKGAIKNKYLVIVKDEETGMKIQQKACEMTGYSPVVITEDEIFNSKIDLNEFVKNGHEIIIYDANSIISKALDKYFGAHISVADIKREV